MNSKISNLARYIIPSVAGLCASFLYIVIDGIFVGQGVGVNALGAVNIALPFTIIMMAIASLVTYGGICITAIHIGQGNNKQANDTFLTSLTLTIILALIMFFGGMFFPRQIALLSGASDAFVDMTSDYIFYCSAFSLPMILSLCLLEFVRNDGFPVLAFWAMLIGAIMNIFLDWLFVFPLQMGIIGAAIASGLGQTGSFLLLISHFIKKKGTLHIKKFSLQLPLAVEIFLRGMPEFISQLGTPVMVLCYNITLVKTLGDLSISSFSVLNYILSLSTGIFMGVSIGIQPLLGQSYGQNNREDLAYYFRAGFLINFAASVSLYILLLFFGEKIVSIFNANPQLIAAATAVIPAFSWEMIFRAMNMTVTIYLFSTKATVQATFIALSRCVVLPVTMIFAIPVLFGAGTVWYALGIAEALTFIFAVILYKISAGKQKRVLEPECVKHTEQ